MPASSTTGSSTSTAHPGERFLVLVSRKRAYHRVGALVGDRVRTERLLALDFAVDELTQPRVNVEKPGRVGREGYTCAWRRRAGPVFGPAANGRKLFRQERPAVSQRARHRPAAQRGRGRNLRRPDRGRKQSSAATAWRCRVWAFGRLGVWVFGCLRLAECGRCSRLCRSAALSRRTS